MMGGMMGGDMGMGGDMSGGMGGMMGSMGSSMNSSAPTGTAEQIQRKTELLAARVRFDFESVQMAIVGTNGGTGIQKMLKEDQTKEKDTLDSILKEIKNTMKFMDEGPEGGLSQNTGGMMGGMMGMMSGDMTMMGTGNVSSKKQKKNASLKIDIPSVKDHLRELLIRYNEMLGIET